jgi:hypothetical protein
MINIATQYLFTMTMKTERQPFGRTPLGERSVVIVTSATITGPRLKATLLPGGSDWITETAEGTILLDCRLVFQTGDGAIIGGDLSWPTARPSGRGRSFRARRTSRSIAILPPGRSLLRDRRP